MKTNTKKIKESRKVFEQLYGREELTDRMYRIISQGKKGLDAFLLELGRMMAETVMHMDREEVSGPEYQPKDPAIHKWASQTGSIYIADQKVGVEHPRRRRVPEGEIVLKSYERLREPGEFSEELLQTILRGVPCRKYNVLIGDTFIYPLPR